MPFPPQRGQGCESANGPWFCETTPRPLHSGQSVGLVPGSAPEPWQAEHTVWSSTGTLTVTPSSESWNETRTAVSTSRPRRAPERLRLRLPIEPAVADLEPLRFVLRRLVGALAAQLAARGVAAQRAHLRLTLDTTFARRPLPEDLELVQRLPEPTAEAEAIERLLTAQLERTPPPAPVAALDLELLDVGPAIGQQLPMFVPQAARSARLGWQLARLAVTYGEDRIARVEITDPDAPLPETRWRWLPVDSGAQRSAGFEAGARTTARSAGGA